MAGENGKSQTGAKYYYYKCGNHKRAQGCKQKALRKEYLEKLVIDQAIKLIHQDGLIDFVAECAARIQKQESTSLPLLYEHLKEVNKGIDNMLNAIQMGIITESTKERLDSLESDKKRLEIAIAEERMEHPEMPKGFFEFWLRRLLSGDTDNEDYRKMMVDVFLNAVYVMDDGIKCALNFTDGVETIPLREWDQAVGSDLLGYAPPFRRDSNYNDSGLFCLVEQLFFARL